jgi:4-carboxymuconolactone decarboxylase
VWQGEELSLQERSLATCATLVALAREPEQRLHFRGARNLGIERPKLEGLIVHVGHYAGWPVAVSALRTLDAVWEEMDAQDAAAE